MPTVGLFEPSSARSAIISDALTPHHHGLRLCKSRHHRYPNGDMAAPKPRSSTANKGLDGRNAAFFRWMDTRKLNTSAIGRALRAMVGRTIPPTGFIGTTVAARHDHLGRGSSRYHQHTRERPWAAIRAASPPGGAMRLPSCGNALPYLFSKPCRPAIAAATSRYANTDSDPAPRTA